MQFLADQILDGARTLPEGAPIVAKSPLQISLEGVSQKVCDFQAR